MPLPPRDPPLQERRFRISSLRRVDQKHAHLPVGQRISHPLHAPRGRPHVAADHDVDPVGHDAADCDHRQPALLEGQPDQRRQPEVGGDEHEPSLLGERRLEIGRAVKLDGAEPAPFPGGPVHEQELVHERADEEKDQPCLD